MSNVESSENYIAQKYKEIADKYRAEYYYQYRNSDDMKVRLAKYDQKAIEHPDKKEKLKARRLSDKFAEKDYV